MKDEKGHGSNARGAAMARLAAAHKDPNHPLGVMHRVVAEGVARSGAIVGQPAGFDGDKRFGNSAQAGYGVNSPAMMAARAAQPAHQSGVTAATAPMQRRQYEAIAGAINSYPGADKADLAQHFAGALSGTNSKFQADKFKQAAMTGNMGKTKNAAPGLTRSHYEAVASTIQGFGKSHPGSGGVVAQHFASELGRRNPNFNADRFMKAAKG